MNIQLENQIKIINMGAVGPNLLSLKRQKEFLTELNYDNCKAIIILGNNKIFCAGLNLFDLVKADKDEVSEIFSTFFSLLKAIRNFPGPVLSVVSGHAIAGGCLLALVCDHRYGVFGFHRMGLNEMALSLDLPQSIFSIISNTINANVLFEVSSQCKLYSPREAYKKGLINEYVSNPFFGKKRATLLALEKAKKLASFYIDAGESFCRLKETYTGGSDYDHEVLVKNWFSIKTQKKIKLTIKQLSER
jgi:enoyl-CoA hydratase/carnithine racemase